MMKSLTVLVLGTAVMVGCQSRQGTGSWASREWDTLEQDAESAVESLSTEGMRHYAAAAILLVLVAGCWTRVRAVSHRHAEASQADEVRDDV